MARTPLFCLVDQNLKDLIGHHFEYDCAAAEGARAHGFEPVCLGHRDAIEPVRAALPFRAAFSRGMWWLPENADRERAIAEANALFSAELDAAVADLPLDASSVVFGHMIVHGQLRAWSRFVERRCRRGGPQVVLLLRYQPDFYRGPSCEAAFRALERSAAAGARVRLATDSARLSGQIARLTRLPVETFPIPHTSQSHEGGVRAPGPLRVVSLGNARDEKGVLELFDAARILELRGDGEGLELVLQVNHPDAEIAPAVERFAADPPGNVRLVSEALSSEAYAELLASADIVATPYWRSIYEARTSGVFLEAVAAGKPVVCTAETWMADELAHAGAGVVTRDRDAAALACALVEARDRFVELSAKALADRPKWRAFHNPERFTEVLLHGAPATDRPLERHVAVLFPWGDDLVEPSTGAARRVKPMLDLLATRYTEVRVLQDVDRLRRRAGAVEFEPDPLLKRSQGRLWFKLARTALKALGARDGEELYALLHLAPARDAAFRAHVDEIVAWADLVLLEYPFWAEVVRAACDRHGKSFVLTSHDVISDQCRSSRALKGITRALERRALSRADRRLALSKADAEVFESWGLETEWSPTGLDVDLLRAEIPGQPRELLNRLCGWPADDQAPLLLFMGSRFRPNLVAVETLQRIAKATERLDPELGARFVVAGACCEARTDGGFVALGQVDELTAHLLRRACALVLAPLTIGTGVSLKAYEAMAAGRALLSTSVGVRGVEGAARAAEIEDDLELWPQRISALLRDPDRRAAVAERCADLGAGMDYRQTYVVYLEAGGVAEQPPVRPEGRDARRRALLSNAAQAAERLGIAETAAACLSAVSGPTTADGSAWIARSRMLAGEAPANEREALALLQAALRRGGDPVEVLRTWADILDAAGLDGVTAALEQAARFRVSRAVAGGGEPELRQEAWAAYHAKERGWALALSREVAAHWPAFARATGDYDYIYADLLQESMTSDAELAIVETHLHRALARGFDAFWVNVGLARVLGRRGGPIAERLGFLEQAFEAAGQDVDRRGLAVNTMVEIAWAAFERGDRDDAAAVGRVAGSKLKTGGVLYLRAELARVGGDLEAARRLYEQAEALGADVGWCRAHRAELLMQAGEVSPAIACALTALGTSGRPHRHEAVGVVCDGLWRLYERRDEALASALERTLGAGVSDGRVWYLQGELMTQQGQPERALDAYGQALALGFDRYWGLRRRAEAKAALGLDDTADRLAAAGAAADLPARIEVLSPLFVAGRRPCLWAEDCDTVLALCPEHGDLRRLVLQARASAPRGKPRVDVGELVTHAGLEIGEAWIAFGKADYRRTLDLAEQLIMSEQTVLNRLAHGHYLIAESLQGLDRDLDDAVRHYTLALDFGFDEFLGRFNRGQSRLKLGDYTGAERDLRAAARVAEDAAQRSAVLASLKALGVTVVDA